MSWIRWAQCNGLVENAVSSCLGQGEAFAQSRWIVRPVSGQCSPVSRPCIDRQAQTP
jgi:hypothetical protein